MTLEEVQKKIELGIDQSQVTMEGDGCNCSAVVVSTFFRRFVYYCKDKERYLHW